MMIDHSIFFPELSTSGDDTCEEENSDGGLKIVLESPNPKRKMKSVELNEAEKELIQSVEKELDDVLEEKATKTNLTTQNVKNILKQVVTNEDVVAMIRLVEDDAAPPPTIYEPKLTRAKAK